MPSMPLLRVGAHNVAPAEVVLIRTLIRLLSHDRSFPWTFADAQPFDALIVDSTVATRADPEVTSAAGAVLTLTRMNADQAADTLARPIRPDRLQAWLRGVAARREGASNDSVMSSSFGSGPQTQPPSLPPALPSAFPSVLPSVLPSVMPSALPSGFQSRLDIAPAALPQLSARAAAPAERFKLKRWPSASMLNNDATQLRLATMLSVRPLSVAELSELSNQGLEACRSFVERMQRAELLGVVSPAPMPGTVATSGHAAAAAKAAPATPAATRTLPSSIGRSLISSLRRRLGL